METAAPRAPRSVERSLAVLAVGAVLGFLWLARELLLPAVLAIFVAFAINPVVSWLERRKVPRSLAALAGTALATLVLAGIGALLYDRISAFWDELPVYQDRLREAYHALMLRATHIQRQSETLIKQPAGSVRVQQGVPWGVLLLGTAQGALSLAGEATIALFTLYFALAEGPRYQQKLLAAMGRDAQARARAVTALREIHRDVQQYVLNRALLNAALGAVTWGIYGLYGLDHAAVWGFTTALLHFVPYVGPAVGIVLPVGMAVLQYGTVKDVALVATIYVILVSLQGNVVDPIFLGRQLRLSSIVVFLGSLFWFWIWGPAGLFLAVPLLSAIRITCAHVPRLQTVSDFLGE